MGSAKHLLSVGDTTLLGFQLARLAESFEQVVVVLGPANSEAEVLPMLRIGDAICHDTRVSAGPMEGLRAGLEFVADRQEIVWATACDLPYFQNSIAERLLDLRQGAAAILFSERGQLSPLPGWYSTELHKTADQFLSAGKRKLGDFVNEVEARIVPIESIAQNSGEARILTNVNTPKDYQELLASLAADGETEKS